MSASSAARPSSAAPASAARLGVDPHRDLSDYDPEADLMVLNMGPQHPSTHGVFRLKLHLDGETIVRAVPYVGYLHRGVEKLLEELTFVQATPIVDKNDYVSPMTNEQAINMAFEALLGIEVPRRARYMRTLFAEMQRIASHLLWLSTFGIDMGGALGGGTTLFMHCFREREWILDLFELVTGARFHYNTHTIGGNRHDIPAGWAKQVHTTLDLIASRIDEYLELSTTNSIFVARTRGVGILPKELALELGITGPILRASGVDHDLRRDAPFHAYDEIEVKVQTEPDGDCLSRALVRVREMKESIRLSKLLVDGIPEGPICGARPIKNPTQFKAKEGQAYVALETPRGELGTYVIGGGKNKAASPYRLKIRPPSLHALSALPYLLPGHSISDTVVILGSLDPIMGEADR
ncbi:MAG: NADH-quinone oxidoreductase subunit D [Deltaproteobacteria bacterium]|nr:NADH-quinone oxidoreductase subunit D [Deltaproteobacteria bacterium]